MRGFSLTASHRTGRLPFARGREQAWGAAGPCFAAAVATGRLAWLPELYVYADEGGKSVLKAGAFFCGKHFRSLRSSFGPKSYGHTGNRAGGLLAKKIPSPPAYPTLIPCNLVILHKVVALESAGDTYIHWAKLAL